MIQNTHRNLFNNFPTNPLHRSLLWLCNLHICTINVRLVDLKYFIKFVILLSFWNIIYNYHRFMKIIFLPELNNKPIWNQSIKMLAKFQWPLVFLMQFTSYLSYSIDPWSYFHTPIHPSNWQNQNIT